MKTIRILMAFIFCFAIAESTQAQSFLERMAKKAEEKAKKEAEKRTEHRINKGIDKTFDKAEEEIDGVAKGDNESNNKQQQESTNGQQPGNNTEQAQASQMNVQWSKFDFVPGDEVIFLDAPDIMEENGEFPSRWDTDGGQTEIANVNGENVILFIDGNPKIIPYLKNAKEDYLPEVFTIEFDLYRAAGSNRFFCRLYDAKNQRHNNNKDITIGYNYIKCGDFTSEHPNKKDYTRDKSRWTHISIAYTKGKLKMYMDDVRLINIPRYEANPTGLTLNAYFANHAEGHGFFVKNVRIAKGGVKYYDRVMQDGKIICNGIRFDVGKATLKPESMGPINKIYELMTKQSDLKFSVEGHTDADGDDAKNQTLSEQRAKTVMQQLISMGIAANRLSSKGFGESKPLDNNSTPEGKANNRRVEFVKFDGNASSFGAKPANNRGNSAYAKINAGNIDKEFDKLSDEFHTPISGPNGIVNGAGTIFLVFTSDRNLCKLEILDVDKNDNYKTTIKYATYNRSGETVSQSNHLEIEGTFPVDLDNGNAKDPARADWDLILKRSSNTNASFGLGGDNIVIRKYE